MGFIVKNNDQCIIFGVLVVSISAINENEICRKIWRCISIFFQRLDSQELEMHQSAFFLLFFFVGLLLVIAVWIYVRLYFTFTYFDFIGYFNFIVYVIMTYFYSKFR